MLAEQTGYRGKQRGSVQTNLTKEEVQRSILARKHM